MKLTSIALRDFRNISSGELEFREARTAITGPNGQGKTNLLEAVHLLCETRSFRKGRTRQLVRQGQAAFHIDGEFSTDLRGFRKAGVRGENGRMIFELDGQAVSKQSEYFGRFPVVALTPEKMAISQGGPDLRRRFLDRIMAIVSPSSLELMQRYRRALKQRSALLQNAGKATELDVWEQELAACGVELVSRRENFLREFLPLFRELHRERFAQEGEAELRYKSQLLGKTRDDFCQELAAHREVDRRMGTATKGPHRDDVDFLLYGRLLRSFGSQGQHKLFMLCLTLAETAVLHRQTGELPLLLLDDLFGELDDERIALIPRAVDAEIQMLITTTSVRHLGVLGESRLQILKCQDGKYHESAA